MRKASRREDERNGANSTYKSSSGFQLGCLNVGTHLYGSSDGNFEILIRVRYMASPLIFNTPNEIIRRLVQRYRFDILCTPLGCAAIFAHKAQAVSFPRMSAVHVVCHVCNARQPSCRLWRMVLTASTLSCRDTHQYSPSVMVGKAVDGRSLAHAKPRTKKILWSS